MIAFACLCGSLKPQFGTSPNLHVVIRHHSAAADLCLFFGMCESPEGVSCFFDDQELRGEHRGGRAGRQPTVVGVRPVCPRAGSDAGVGWLGTLLRDAVEEDTALTLLGPFRLRRVSQAVFGALLSHPPSQDLSLPVRCLQWPPCGPGSWGTQGLCPPRPPLSPGPSACVHVGAGVMCPCGRVCEVPVNLHPSARLRVALGVLLQEPWEGRRALEGSGDAAAMEKHPVCSGPSLV